MAAEEYLIARYGAYRGHYEWRALESAFNAGASQKKPYSKIAQSIRDYGFRKGNPCDIAYSVLVAMQEDWGEWLDSFFGTREEQMQGRVFCLIVAEALS